ncbi:hypothetical protein [Actinokineospora sp.]|uniref:hypothetical protein n=1 Tax=Actinokineospora sp. TaxID=1872133 RepID=UPI004037CD13
MTSPKPSAFVVPPDSPRAARQAHTCLAVVFALAALNLLVTLVLSEGATGLGGAGIALALAAGTWSSATSMRAGRRSGRTGAVVLGAILAALQVFGLAIVFSLRDLLDSGPFALAVLVSVTVIGLIVAGLALMFRSEVSAYLDRQ